ncbi:hypothetical protein BRADI_1g54082v3 [Brachypodium distachyon]|uniref:Uncharacterized protein n=1 Tax=Brachypodium distachyon TaxID=15368 RepID=A0A2K2DRC1_BRADI|nr:hypothetical protein BRADI_1g54082v3 [Brachypodium distachyon]
MRATLPATPNLRPPAPKGPSRAASSLFSSPQRRLSSALAPPVAVAAAMPDSSEPEPRKPSPRASSIALAAGIDSDDSCSIGRPWLSNFRIYFDSGPTFAGRSRRRRIDAYLQKSQCTSSCDASWVRKCQRRELQALRSASEKIISDVSLVRSVRGFSLSPTSRDVSEL